MELISVVLPMPLWPSSASDWPSSSASEMSASTTAWPYPAAKRARPRSSGIEGLAEIDLLHPLIAGDLFGRSLDEQLAIDEHGNAIGEAEHDVHVVRDG